MQDRNFVRTVILMIHHDEPGAVGVVLNRPTTLAVERLPQGWNIVGPVFAGGPVEPEVAIGLADADGGKPGWERVGDGLWLADLDATPVSPPRIRVYAGYAGWSEGQLEAEIVRGDWVIADAGLEDVFAADPANLWTEVLRRQPGTIPILASYPSDPSLN